MTDGSSLEAVERCLESDWLRGTILHRDQGHASNVIPFALSAAGVIDATSALPVSEQRAAEPFAPRRRKTFSTGRQCARAALQLMGSPPVPLNRLDNGAVQWPAGFVGSISHTDDIAIAVVAKTQARPAGGRLLSVGIDVEQRRTLEPDVIKLVTTPAEREWLAGRPSWQPLALFSTRESIYKCLFPLVNRYIDFAAVSLGDLDAAPVICKLADEVTVLALSVQLHDQELAAHVGKRALSLRLAVLPTEVLSIAILSEQLVVPAN